MAYDPGAYLSYGDVTLDDRVEPTLAQVCIKASKSDPFCHGVLIFLDKVLCPVAALAAYIAVMNTARGSFFQFRDGSPLTREKLVTQLRNFLDKAGVVSENFAGHSFRIGAATTGQRMGLQDSLVQTLGWKTAAYLKYIRIRRQ